MTNKQKQRIVERAMRLHGDTPTVEQGVAVAADLYPEWADPQRERLLRAIVSFELSEAYKRNRFIRGAAAERGVDPALPIKTIRKLFETPIPETDESRPYVGSSRAVHHAAAAV